MDLLTTDPQAPNKLANVPHGRAGVLLMLVNHHQETEKLIVFPASHPKLSAECLFERLVGGLLVGLEGDGG